MTKSRTSSSLSENSTNATKRSVSGPSSGILNKWSNYQRVIISCQKTAIFSKIAVFLCFLTTSFLVPSPHQHRPNTVPSPYQLRPRSEMIRKWSVDGGSMVGRKSDSCRSHQNGTSSKSSPKSVGSRPSISDSMILLYNFFAYFTRKMSESMYAAHLSPLVAAIL